MKKSVLLVLSVFGLLSGLASPMVANAAPISIAPHCISGAPANVALFRTTQSTTFRLASNTNSTHVLAQGLIVEQVGAAQFSTFNGNRYRRVFRPGTAVALWVRDAHLASVNTC